LAAFDEVDASLTGIHVDVTAATQDGPGAALDDFDAQRTLYGNGFALDCADGVVGRLVGAGGGRKVQNGEEQHRQREAQGYSSYGCLYSVTFGGESGGNPPHSKKSVLCGASWRQ
jgi:hypothetical protein